MHPGSGDRCRFQRGRQALDVGAGEPEEIKARLVPGEPYLDRAARAGRCGVVTIVAAQGLA